MPNTCGFFHLSPCISIGLRFKWYTLYFWYLKFEQIAAKNSSNSNAKLAYRSVSSATLCAERKKKVKECGNGKFFNHERAIPQMGLEGVASKGGYSLIARFASVYGGRIAHGRRIRMKNGELFYPALAPLGPRPPNTPWPQFTQFDEKRRLRSLYVMLAAFAAKTSNVRIAVSGPVSAPAHPLAPISP